MDSSEDSEYVSLSEESIKELISDARYYHNFQGSGLDELLAREKFCGYRPQLKLKKISLYTRIQAIIWTFATHETSSILASF